MSGAEFRVSAGKIASITMKPADSNPYFHRIIESDLYKFFGRQFSFALLDEMKACMDLYQKNEHSGSAAMKKEASWRFMNFWNN